MPKAQNIIHINMSILLFFNSWAAFRPRGVKLTILTSPLYRN